MNMIRYEQTPDVGIQWHPYADIFPWIEGVAFEEFKEDIRANGVREPIVFFEGKILDGRNRYTAARELGIEYPRTEYEGNDPLGFVISVNLKRRHLTESQRAMVAARLATARVGNPTFNRANLPDSAERANLPIREEPTNAEAAKMLNVSERSIKTAKQVQKTGVPELVKAVEQGTVAVSAAAVIAKQDEDTQRRLVAEDKLKRAAADLKKAEAEAKEAEKLPKAEPLTDEQKAEQRRIFGTEEDRAIGARIDEIIDRINEQPGVFDAVSRIPPAERHTISIPDIRAASAWLSAFADAWEAHIAKENEHGLEAAE